MKKVHFAWTTKREDGSEMVASSPTCGSGENNLSGRKARAVMTREKCFVTCSKCRRQFGIATQD